MNRGFIFFLIVLSLGFKIEASKPVKVKATVTYRANRNETPADAERIALQRAKIKAIEEAFGMRVSETSVGMQSTKVDENYFSAVSDVSVKGEWIETIGKPIFEQYFDDRIPVITCTVEGYVKEIDGVRVEYEAKILKGSPNEKFISSDFQDGDEMYIYFKSPVNGFLNIFLICLDDDTALCLLPYRESKEGAFKIEADKEYYFFSKDKATINPELVDEYKLSTERQTEINEVYLIFSTDEFNKTTLKVKEDEITAIKETSIPKFNKWLAKLQTNNKNITLKPIPIKITRK